MFRGLCAFVVFFHHWQAWSLFPAVTEPEAATSSLLSSAVRTFERLTWNTGGHHPAVIAFMVLSGYCIHSSRIGGRPASPQASSTWPDYLRRRLVRILPVYWVGAALGILFLALQTAWPTPHPTLAFYSQGAPTDIAVRLLGLASFYPHELLVGNSPLNYVACELVIYLLYPLAFSLMRPRRWAWLFAAALLGQTVAFALAHTLDPFWAFNTPLMLMLFWLLGARLAAARPTPSAAAGATTFLLSLAAFYLMREAVPAFPARNLLLQLLWALVCVAAISLCVRLEQLRPELGRHPLTRRLRGLGRASYSLYVVHSPALFLSGWALLQLLPAPTYGLQLAGGLAATLVLTPLSFHLVERPCLRRLSRRTVPPNTPAAPPPPVDRLSPVA